MADRKIDVICGHCEKVFQVIPSRLKHGRGKHCSPACQYAAKRATPSTKSIECICIGCGSLFVRNAKSSAAKKGGGKYCTRPCRDKYRTGDKTSNWFGAPRVYYRGTNWHKQRRAARKRDHYKCQSNGCDADGTDVHHIVPYRLFDGDWERANDLLNLVTVCRSCHRRIEAALQKEELASLTPPGNTHSV